MIMKVNLKLHKTIIRVNFKLYKTIMRVKIIDDEWKLE